MKRASTRTRDMPSTSLIRRATQTSASSHAFIIETPGNVLAIRQSSLALLIQETTPGIFARITFEFRDTLRKGFGNQGLSSAWKIRKEQDNNNLLGGARPEFTFATLFQFRQ